MAHLYTIRGQGTDEDETASVKYADVWSGFSSFTTTHGIPHVIKAKGSCLKCITQQLI